MTIRSQEQSGEKLVEERKGGDSALREAAEAVVVVEVVYLWIAGAGVRVGAGAGVHEIAGSDLNACPIVMLLIGESHVGVSGYFWMTMADITMYMLLIWLVSQGNLCNNCKRPGHFARECPNVAICNNCNLPGHIASECTTQSLCWNCREPGHMASNCPNEGICHSCNKTGHRARDCPTPGLPSGDLRLCNNCYKQGHIAADCTNDKACKNCRKTGHIARDCQNEPVCNLCNIAGHVARQCPKAEIFGERGGGGRNTGFRDVICRSCNQVGAIWHLNAHREDLWTVCLAGTELTELQPGAIFMVVLSSECLYGYSRIVEIGHAMSPYQMVWITLPFLRSGITFMITRGQTTKKGDNAPGKMLNQLKNKVKPRRSRVGNTILGRRWRMSCKLAGILIVDDCTVKHLLHASIISAIADGDKVHHKASCSLIVLVSFEIWNKWEWG
ncbi:hypothetical protein AAG906_018227 [Vitis piasezkii]